MPSFLASSSSVSALNVATWSSYTPFFSPLSSGIYAFSASGSNSLPGHFSACVLLSCRSNEGLIMVGKVTCQEGFRHHEKSKRSRHAQRKRTF